MPPEANICDGFDLRAFYALIWLVVEKERFELANYVFDIPMGGSCVARPPRFGSGFLTLRMRLRSSNCWLYCMSSLCLEMLDAFWKSRLAKAWFSRSILSFSFRRTEMLSERGPTLAAFLFFNCLFVAGPCTDDHFPWLISTNLLSKIAFSRFKSIFFSKE